MRLRAVSHELELPSAFSASNIDYMSVDDESGSGMGIGMGLGSIVTERFNNKTHFVGSDRTCKVGTEYLRP